MDLVDELRIFVATAQTGSFTGAAGQLGVSNRLTSKYIAELEARLGVRLFQRTTRRVGLTPAGEDLLARAPALLDDLDDLLAEVSESTKGLTGTIRISAPTIFGEIYVAGMLARFLARHPGLTLDLRLDDRYADLAREGIDLAFRIGTTEMLSVRARKLGGVRSALAASPDYIARRGAPQTPQALAAHACLIDVNRRVPRRWVFLEGAVEHAVTVAGPIQVNSARAAVRLAEEGLGIVSAPRFAFGDALESGRLVPLLEGYVGDVGPVSAVYLEGRVLPRKIRALIDFAAEDIRTAGVL